MQPESLHSVFDRAISPALFTLPALFSQVETRLQGSVALVALQKTEDEILTLEGLLESVDRGLSDNAQFTEEGRHPMKRQWHGAEPDACDAAPTAPPLSTVDAGRERRHLRELLHGCRSRRRELKRKVDELRRSERANVLREAHVVLSTLSSSGSGPFEDAVQLGRIRFTHVLIDEAAQATEPSCLVPLKYGASKLMLVGDPRQLPATVRSRNAGALGLERSLFERLEECGEIGVQRLTVQYRMHPAIRTFPSARFYEGSLLDGPGTACPPTTSFGALPPHACFPPLLCLDLKGSQEERCGTSYRNPCEAMMAVHLALHILAALRGGGEETGGPTVPVAILCPYKSQVLAVRRLFESEALKMDAAGAGHVASARSSPAERPGDWRCPNAPCSAMNFGRNLACFRCSEQKPPPDPAALGSWWGRAAVSSVDGFQGREAEVTAAADARQVGHR